MHDRRYMQKTSFAWKQSWIQMSEKRHRWSFKWVIQLKFLKRSSPYWKSTWIRWDGLGWRSIKLRNTAKWPKFHLIQKSHPNQKMRFRVINSETSRSWTRLDQDWELGIILLCPSVRLIVVSLKKKRRWFLWKEAGYRLEVIQTNRKKGNY